MVKQFVVTFVLGLLFATVACAQPQKQKGTPGPPAPRRGAVTTPTVDRNKLREQADALGKAFAAGDFDKVADMTLPDVVKLGGGRVQLVAFLKKNTDEMRAQGFNVEAVTSGEPTQVIGVGKEVYAVVPTTMRMKVPQGVLIGEAFFIGISDDGGESWLFIDGAGMTDKRRLQMFIPSAWDKLNLPAQKPPVLQPIPQR